MFSQRPHKEVVRDHKSNTEREHSISAYEFLPLRGLQLFFSLFLLLFYISSRA